MKRLLAILCAGCGFAMGQTLEEGKAEFKAQKAELETMVGEAFRSKLKVFAEKTGEDEKAYRDQLEKAHIAWLGWAELQARAQVAAEPKEKREALFWMARAWLYEQKSRELKEVLGGAENFTPIVIDDPRVNVLPLDFPASIYSGEMSGKKGCFALQWTEDEGVRGAFVSDDEATVYRLFGDNSEKGVVKFLCIPSGADAGLELVVRKTSEGGKLVWSGGSEKLGAVKLQKQGEAQGRREGRPASYLGSAGKAKLRIGLEWAEAGTVTGSWLDQSSGIPGDLLGLNYQEGRLYLDRWQEAGDVEGGVVVSMWFLRKTSGKPVTWAGTAVSLNGYVEEVSFTKENRE